MATRTDVGVARPPAPVSERPGARTDRGAGAQGPSSRIVAAMAAALLAGAALAWLGAAPRQPLSP